jgi:bifunctional non-homologous end joining protein LigD
MLLGRKAEPFDDPDYLFELKYDGFRSFAVIRNGECSLVSRNGNDFKTFETLRVGLPADFRATNVIIDGEIACLDGVGRSVFDELFYRRREPVFIAFDVLRVEDTDLRSLPLLERKKELKLLLKSSTVHSLLSSHIEGRGIALYGAACEHDLEGIVAKHKHGRYVSGREETSWFKIRNRNYSQWEGREEKFERPHEPNPPMGWDGCCEVVSSLEPMDSQNDWNPSQ